LLGAGDSGAPVVLVPSLINPSTVLDLDEERSLLGFLGASGRQAMLLDWGVPTAGEATLDIAGHVETLLLPLLETIGEPVHLVGYCLGGTISTAAAQLAPVRSLTLLATPWRFAGYPVAARTELGTLWKNSRAIVDALGLMPIELLQTAFWSLDPERTLAKYAALADLAKDDPALAAFAGLEDWANDGAPLTAAVSADLFERLIADDETGRGVWRVGGEPIVPVRLACPAFQLTANNDHIVPAATADDRIRAQTSDSGHVGMVVGSRAESQCWRPLLDWTALH
jgi:polyhydroxyalkanoate synthase subunit PhaC